MNKTVFFHNFNKKTKKYGIENIVPGFEKPLESESKQKQRKKQEKFQK